MGKNVQKKPQNNNMKKVLAAVSVLVMLVLVYTFYFNDKPSEEGNKNAANSKSVVKDSDIVIPLNSVTETATFYPAEIEGTKLEVLAVKAPDGSVRTAFNTCQVCYSSGRGYYVQEGDVLVCQNCGNRFSMDDVEVTRGGCNPVPITEEYKTVDADNITVSKEFLKEATVIFQNWKK